MHLPHFTPRQFIFIAMVAAFAIIVIDQSAVPIALPSIQQDLNISGAIGDWIINAYLLTLASSIVIAGKFADLFGFRRVLFIGLIIFSISSCLIAFSGNAVWLILLRAVQGIGGACIFPTVLAIIIEIYPEENRGQALGNFVGLTSLFFVSAPFIGGLLTHYLSWRFIFWINLPITAFCLLIAGYFLPKSVSVDQIKIDFPGFMLLITSFVALSLALMQLGSVHTTQLIIVAAFAIFFVSTPIFILYERKQKNPIVDLKLFKIKHFRLSVLALILNYINGIAVVFWVLLFQYAFGASPIQAAVMMLPGILPVIVMAPFSGYLRDKIGVKIPALIAAFNMVAANIWLGSFVWFESYWLLIPGLILFGSSTSMLSGSFMQTAMNATPIKQRGEGTGITICMRPFGNSIGFALVSAIINLSYFHAIKYQLFSLGTPFNTIATAKLGGLLAGTETSKLAMQVLPTAMQSKVYLAAIHGYSLGFSIAMFFLASISAVIFLLARQLPMKVSKNLIGG